MKKSILKYGIIVLVVIAVAVTVLLLAFSDKKVIVPDVIGKNITEATELLEQEGFKVTTNFEYSETIKKNTVISQNVSGGTEIEEGSEIIISVSKGKEQVTLPNVKNSSATAAIDTLKALGFEVKTQEAFSSKVPKGDVIGQSVAEGQKADKGAVITITISKGPDLVSVPKVTGLTLENAKQALNGAGFVIKTEIQCSNTVKEGIVISQDVAEDQQIDRGSAVSVKISAGVANTKGTTPSNANSYGKVTIQGDWIYFAGKNSIYRVRKDKSETQKVCDVTAVSLNVVGEWVYFVDGSSAGGIYKIRLDGTQKTKLNNLTSYKMYVEGEWIYYTSEYWGGKLCKMKTDGSSATEIVNAKCVEYIVNDGYVYYVTSTDNLVYKCTTDGKNNTIFCAGFAGSDLALLDNKLAIIKSNDIFTVNLDGSGFTSVKSSSNLLRNHLNGYDGWLYFLEHEFDSNGQRKSAFVRMRYDGSQKTKIYDYYYLNHGNYCLNVVDGWLYFKNEHDNDTLYRVNFDGTKVERLG